MLDNEKIIYNLMDCVRDVGINSQQSFKFVLQLIAWVKLSITQKVPKQFSFNSAKIPSSAEDLEKVFKFLAEDKNLGGNSSAFEQFYLPVDNTSILNTCTIVQRLVEQNLLNDFTVPNSVLLTIFSDKSDCFFIPDEIVNYMLAIAGDLKGKSIYCPYDNLCQFSRQAYLLGGKVSAEIFAANSSIAMLVNLINRAKISVAVSDPVVSPSFIKNGKLEQFDYTISFPPMGYKYDRDISKKDIFSRFVETTSNGSILSIRHILAQTENKAVVAVPKSNLFSAGAELLLRRYLLEKNWIKAVIDMPPALLPSTNVPFAILLIDMKQKSNSVRFVDTDNKLFYSRDGKGRSIFHNWIKAIEILEKETDSFIAIDIPTKIVLDNEKRLQVSQYLTSPEQDYIEELLEDEKTTNLEEVVEFVRPLRPSKKGTIAVLEARIPDFPEYGYLPEPEREVMVAFDPLNKKDINGFLKPYDIVLSTKGNVNKTAIVPEHCPPPQEGGWIVNQSCLILRSEGTVDPRFLITYLRSEVGQYSLDSLVVGASVPLIQLDMLRKLKVIIPTQEVSRQVISTFTKQVEIQSQIEKLQAEQKRLALSHWQIAK